MKITGLSCELDCFKQSS